MLNKNKSRINENQFLKYKGSIKSMMDLSTYSITLKQILNLADQRVGFRGINSTENIIASSTWRKYVKLYNEFNSDKILKIGNTKGTRYKLRDVHRVLDWQPNKSRLEDNWFNKTFYIPLEHSNMNSDMDDDLDDCMLSFCGYEEIIDFEKNQISKEDFFKLIKKERSKLSENKQKPISELSKMIGHPRIENHFKEGYRKNIDELPPSILLTELPKRVERELLGLFDLEKLLMFLNHFIMTDGHERESYEDIRNNPLVFLKEEHRKALISLEKDGFWDIEEGEEDINFWRREANEKYYSNKRIQDYYFDDEKNIIEELWGI